MTARRGICAALLLACGACGPSVEDSPIEPDLTPLAGLQSISISPADAALVIENGVPATAEYQAVGTFLDGHEEDISHRVRFSLADADAGRFEGNQLTSSTE